MHLHVDVHKHLYLCVYDPSTHLSSTLTTDAYMPNHVSSLTFKHTTPSAGNTAFHFFANLRAF